ncbi:creatininase family protein [Brevibacterium sp. UCMA 11754]|nr:creatininase family protein [Brevibacterium sp. UCMA 11754]
MHELEMLTARQLRRQVDAGYSTVVVPFGSLENHGGHLPLGADVILADAGGAQVAQRLGAVLALAVRIGDSVRHQELFGTLSLTIAPLTTVAVEHGRGLARQGFASLVLLSPWGNQVSLDTAVLDLNASLHGAATVSAPRGDVGPDPRSYLLARHAWLARPAGWGRRRFLAYCGCAPQLSAGNYNPGSVDRRAAAYEALLDETAVVQVVAVEILSPRSRERTGAGNEIANGVRAAFLNFVGLWTPSLRRRAANDVGVRCRPGTPPGNSQSSSVAGVISRGADRLC